MLIQKVVVQNNHFAFSPHFVGVDVGAFGVIYRVVQAARFFALQCLAGNQITHIDHIAQFADVFCCLHAFEQVFGLLVEQIQSLPCTAQTQVATHNTHIGGHHLTDLAHVLRDKHMLLVSHGTFVVPVGDILVEIVVFNHTERVFGCRIGINNCLDEGVTCQRLPPCKPVQLHSPTAYKRRIVDCASKSTLIPPHI